jgi:hypothetical protein
VRATVKVAYGRNSFLLLGGPLASKYGNPGSAAFDRAYFGLEPTLSTAYQLAPFSFVLDWFVGFGRVLAQWVEKPIPELEYEIVHTGWSVKTTAQCDLTVQCCTGLYNSDYGSVKAAGHVPGSITSEQYSRAPKAFDPTVFTPSPPQFKLPSLQKAVTLVELIAQLTSSKKRLFRVNRPGR